MTAVSDSSSSLLHDMTKPLMVVAIVLVLLLFISEVILGPFSYLRLIGSRGKVKVLGVGVYWDANCTSPVYYVDWGIVKPNSFKDVTLFIRNEGNEPSSLFLNTTNWNPPNAADFITLSWDYDGHVIYAQQTTEATLTLSVAEIAEGIEDFTFDIVVGVSG